jgi:hypothetical protein
VVQATCNQNRSLVKLLHKHGADINELCHVDIVESHGNKIEIKDKVPAILVAVFTKQTKLAKLLLDTGADANYSFVCEIGT